MSTRNLTSHSPYTSEDLSSSDGNNTSTVKNPFLDDAEEEDSSAFPSHNASNSSLLHHNSSDSPNQSNLMVSDYNGYYAKGKENPPPKSSNITGLPSSTSLYSHGLNSISNNDILSPPAFDRYPLVGSRVASMAAINNANNVGSSTNNNNNNGYSGSSANNSSSSITSSNPFLSDQDFSPFGGYPATSFPLHMDEKEDDDYLHNPDPEEEARLDKKRFSLDFKHMDRRSAGGMLGILFLFLGAIALFVILPVLTYTGAGYHGHNNNVVELLTLYEYNTPLAIRTSLVDPDTPSDVKTRKSKDGSDWELVFSDEFNAVGRTFYDGDSQFWTAPDLHYDATKDLEWYTPDAVTTANGTLKLRMDAYKNHDLYYRSGMVQSWNKLCFTQGTLEISANLPNYGRVTGLWPGLWTMGNLARPGFLATSDGVWPYSYEACDAGITPNQSSPDGISYLPGQRLSVCTCDNEEHPSQGVGRGAPEIDVLEAEADTRLGVGVASQSMQIAPFDIWYIPDYDFVEIYNSSVTTMNTYCGGPFQQAVSGISSLNTTWYQFGPDAGYFQKYVLEYLNDDENGYVRWYVGDTPTFTIYAKALHPNGNIDWRRISKEPMSIIMNLGISNNWAYIDWQFIFFPVTMSIDYVRLYQPPDAVSLTCDPPDYPTYDYIESHKNAYLNANLTSWKAAGYSTPKNILTGNCKSSKFSLPK